MKLVLPSIFTLLFNKKINFFMFIFPLILFFSIIKTFNSKLSSSSSYLFTDLLSWMMMMLTLISVLLIIISSNHFKNISKMIFTILIILIITFSMANMFNFYIMFEMVLIPTMILVTKMGKQPERLQAGIYLILYTVFASLPLLVSILYLKNNPSFIFIFLSLYKFKLTLLLITAFLVKMPMFFTHLWLPKAHVEAPLEGSMILAAILLKLGGFGLIRILPACLFNLSSIPPYIMSISLLGASMTGMNCIRQKDMKSLIAYSSVAHMALTLASIMTLNNLGLIGAITMMIAHGLSSSALFFLANDLYTKTHSRNIMIFKGLISLMPNITFWWFIFTAVNISAPPTINTLSEVFIMSSLMSWNMFMIFPIIITSFITTSFSLSLYINISHNKTEFNIFNTSKQKTFLSLFIHFIPLILLLMKMDMFI